MANLLSGDVDEYFARTTSNGTQSYMTDALGSTLALTDATGTVNTQYSYEAYGNTTQSGTVSDNAYQYTGRENDGTGLYYYRARYYDTQTSRFISQDPIGFGGGVNQYTYVNGNPVSLVDPLGLAGADPEPGLEPICVECIIPAIRGVAKAASVISKVCKRKPQSKYPPNRGFSGKPETVTLPSGTLLDRYGSPNGTFASPAGTPFSARSLPESSANAPLTTYQVVEPIEVQAGTAAPWFGQPGGGVQYELPNTIQQLLDSGQLK
ncbi:glycohydrolase toxin TNT-related protein [Sulfuriferula thiophila]|uniref:glycohydrolase toxin TNT-related protein n=1 Tax=Sulfuriferula thiophila TaxID=1781211 RepID=UPI000F60EAC9|nr:glycohydrolase toxin TNT-related protein [Sulfuriferula thiophila]